MGLPAGGDTTRGACRLLLQAHKSKNVVQFRKKNCSCRIHRAAVIVRSTSCFLLELNVWILWGCCFCQQIFMLRTEKSKKVNVTLDRIEWARERYLFWISSPVWETATQDVAAAGHHSDTPAIFNSSMISSVILLRADRSITGLSVVYIGQTRTVSHLLLALRQSMVIFLRFVSFRNLW